LVALYLWLRAQGTPLDELRTVMFVALSLDAIFFTFSLKSLDTPVWRINPFSNWYLVVALTTSIALLLAALIVPSLQHLLSLVPLTTFEKLLLLGVGVSNLVTIEVMKYVYFASARPASPPFPVVRT
jgi:Ca2+-transporting ATPase